MASNGNVKLNCAGFESENTDSCPFMDETIMFFRSIDPGLVRYVDELLKLSVSSGKHFAFYAASGDPRIEHAGRL